MRPSVRAVSLVNNSATTVPSVWLMQPLAIPTVLWDVKGAGEPLTIPGEPAPMDVDQ